MQRIFFLIFLGLNFFCALQAQTTGYTIGDKATDFYLKGTDDKIYSMANYHDAQGFIIIFTCNSCPFAVMYEDRINALAKKFKKEGYILLAINPNDPEIKPEDSFTNLNSSRKCNFS